MAQIPKEIRDEVNLEIYRQVDELDWDGMTDRDRSQKYMEWIDDSRIGLKLARFIERDRIRVWIKDGAIKELPRARFGIGSYSRFAQRQYPGPGRIAQLAFGPEWSAVSAVEVKPNRCVIEGPDGRNLMIWGEASKLADLVWRGIISNVDRQQQGNPPEPVIVVATPQGTRLSDGDKLRHRLLAREAGITLHHITLRLESV